MTRDALIAIMLQRLGQRQNDTVLQAAAVAELNLAQERLEQDAFKPWFLLSEVQSTNVAAGEERVALPPRFLREPDEGALWRVNSDGTLSELKKDDYDALKARYQTAGTPKAYSISGGYLRLHPTPDAVYTLKSQFYIGEAPITDVYGLPGSTATNKWYTNASDLMLCITGHTLAKYYTRDADAAAGFLQDGTLARQKLITETIARAEANAMRQMGDD